MIVRGYYEIHLDDEEVNIDNKEDVIKRAKTLFDYDIQDKDVHSGKMSWEVIE